MKISGDVVFYWISAKFPGTVHIFAESEPQILVHNAIFFEKRLKTAGHLVLITPEQVAQNVSLPRDCVYLCVGTCPEAEGLHRELIMLKSGAPAARVYNLLTELFERFDAWEETLERAVTDFFSYQSIVRSCDGLIMDPMALTDIQFHYISYSKRLAAENGYEDAFVDRHDCLPLETVDLITSDPNYASLSERRGVFRYVAADDFLHRNIFSAGAYVGRLSIPHKRDEATNRYYAWVLDIVGGYVERLYEKTGTFWSRRRQNSALKDILTGLLSGTPARTEQLRQELERLGYGEGDRYCLIQLRSHFTDNRDKLSRSLSAQLEDRWPGTTCFISDGLFFVLLNRRAYDLRASAPFFQTLAVMLRESLLIAGVSREFTDVSELQVAAHQTREAIEIGSQRDATFWYFKFDDYAFECLLRKGMNGFLPAHICSPVLLRLEEYDRENGTELGKTLRLYIANRFNAVSTAKELFVARSTFLKRIERIGELTGLEWSNPTALAYIAVSYRLADMYSEKSKMDFA